jgi:hypothetical protein
MEDLQKVLKTLANKIVDVKGIHRFHLVEKIQKELMLIRKNERTMNNLKILIHFGILM